MKDDLWWFHFVLSDEGKNLVGQILTRLDEIGKEKQIYPEPSLIFRALSDMNKTKVIILGQDPYHGPRQANGYAFAVNREMAMPPSLQNIFKELNDDIGEFQTDRTLEQWARQGVMLLNTTLTVSEGEPGSHYSLGWVKVTSKVIEHLSNTRDHLVFILWGAHAQKMSRYIENYESHLVIQSPHPSPLSAYRGFFGSKPFSRTNEWLIQHEEEPIQW